MSDFEEVDILLAEDSDTDAEMTLRALRMDHVSSIVLSQVTAYPFTALSLKEAFSAFGIPPSFPGA